MILITRFAQLKVANNKNQALYEPSTKEYFIHQIDTVLISQKKLGWFLHQCIQERSVARASLML